MKRVKYTEEERKEARRIAQAKWTAKNKEYKAKYNAENKEARKEYQDKYDLENKEAIKEYRAKYKAENKEAIKKSNAKYRASLRTHFVVYKHTNSKGDIYIGCGTNLRPHQFKGNDRSKEWHEAFNDDCEITIISEFKDKESARELEKSLIQSIGLSNLVNVIA